MNKTWIGVVAGVAALFMEFGVVAILAAEHDRETEARRKAFEIGSSLFDQELDRQNRERKEQSRKDMLDTAKVIETRENRPLASVDYDVSHADS